MVDNVQPVPNRRAQRLRNLGVFSTSVTLTIWRISIDVPCNVPYPGDDFWAVVLIRLCG